MSALVVVYQKSKFMDFFDCCKNVVFEKNKELYSIFARKVKFHDSLI